MRKDPRFPSPCAAVAAFSLILAAAFAAIPLRAQQYPQNASQPGSSAGPQSNQSNPSNVLTGQSGFTVPSSFTLPAGTLITVRTEQFLSSNKNHAGDIFNADLAQPLVVGGWVVARRGQPVIGEVSVAQKAGHMKGQSKLGVELTTLVVADGRQFPVTTRLFESSAPSGAAERAAGTLGGATAIGAAIGAAAGGGQGAGIGAALGAEAGLAGLMLTRGRPTVIPPESLLTFQMESPITFTTEGRALAYQPVTEQDYAPAGPTLQQRPRPVSEPPYPRYYWPPYGYPGWGYYYGYPVPFFVGIYGFGGGFYRGYGRLGRGYRR